ncbi:putative NLI interacting factor-like phosphatase domain-containing protein [Cryptosporidium felis]|nr:putative NLI interacting factor-like phosphatase domain-containing protein [Cryptosporidium felis]
MNFNGNFAPLPIADCSMYSSALLNENGEFSPEKLRKELLKANEVLLSSMKSKRENKRIKSRFGEKPPEVDEHIKKGSNITGMGNSDDQDVDDTSPFEDDYDPFSDPVSTGDQASGNPTFHYSLNKFNSKFKQDSEFVGSLGVSKTQSSNAVLPDDAHLASTVPKDYLAQNKLVAILDLDNTLLHAYNSTKIGCNINLEDFVSSSGDPEMYKFVLPQDLNTPYYLKLRPGVREFLSTISPYYIMGICTNATREYADVIRAVLDPQRDKFGDRIVARESVDGRDTQKDFRKICMDVETRAIVLLDDRSDVWDSSLESQVVKAQTYEYFEQRKDALKSHYPPLSSGASSISANSSAPGDILSAALSSLSSSSGSNSIADYDRHLDYLIRVFKELHARFFRDPEKATVGEILRKMRSEILEDCVICFTGFLKAEEKPVIKGLPSNWGDSQADAESAAARLGASIEENLEPLATHLVVQKTNTAKFHQARSNPSIKIVHTLWLWACDGQWQRVPEDLFEGESLSDKFNQSTVLRPWNVHWEILAQKEGKVGIHSFKFRLTSESGSNTTIKEYQHPAAWRQSSGARIWSPREIVTLTFT